MRVFIACTNVGPVHYSLSIWYCNGVGALKNKKKIKKRKRAINTKMVI